MADQYVPLPVKTKTAGDIVANINNGTVTSVSNLAAGTITSIVAGTQNTLGTVGVLNSQAAGTQQTLGTVGVVNNIVGGTIGSVLGIGGTVQVSGAAAGTFVNIVTGTQQTLGTVGVVNSIVAGTQNTLGTVGVVNSVAAGTVNTLGTVGSVTNIGSLTNAGTIKEISNIAGGTVTVTNYPGASSPQFSYQTASALAAAALGTLTFTAITNAKTGQLHKVVMSSSVPIRGEIQRVNDTGATIGTAGVIFTSAANPTFDFTLPADTYFTQASTGTAKFRTVITNMDNALAADVYASAFWDEV